MTIPCMGSGHKQRPEPKPAAARPGRPTRTAPAILDPASLVRAALESPGEPVQEAIRRRLEESLGADLSGVRVHTGPVADASARAVNARAYTVGEEIVLAEPAGSELERRRTLAHELAHVVQQRRGPVSGVPGPGGVLLSVPGDRFEQAADRAAAAALAGQSAPGAGTLARELAHGIRRPQAGSVTAVPTAAGPPVVQRKLDFRKAPLKKVLTWKNGKLGGKLSRIPRAGRKLDPVALAFSYDLIAALIKYDAASGPQAEQAALTELSSACLSYISKSRGDKKAAEYVRAVAVLNDVAEEEVMRSMKAQTVEQAEQIWFSDLEQSEQTGQYSPERERLGAHAFTQLRSPGGGERPAERARRIMDPSIATTGQSDAGTRAVAAQRNLTARDVAAIHLYGHEAADFEYMGPALANIPGWMMGNVKKEVGKGTRADDPSWFDEGPLPQDKLAEMREQRTGREMRTEGSLHNTMALRAMLKLEPKRVKELWRGSNLRDDLIPKAGAEVELRTIESWAPRRSISEGFLMKQSQAAPQNSGSDVYRVMFRLENPTQGRDIGLMKGEVLVGEGELALPLGYRWKVVKREWVDDKSWWLITGREVAGPSKAILDRLS